MNGESVTRTIIRTKRTITQSFIIVTAQAEQFGGKVRGKAEMGEEEEEEVHDVVKEAMLRQGEMDADFLL